MQHRKQENSKENKQISYEFSQFFLPRIQQRPHVSHARTHFANRYLVNSKFEIKTRYDFNSLDFRGFYLHAMLMGAFSIE